MCRIHNNVRNVSSSKPLYVFLVFQTYLLLELGFRSCVSHSIENLRLIMPSKGEWMCTDSQASSYSRMRDEYCSSCTSYFIVVLIMANYGHTTCFLFAYIDESCFFIWVYFGIMRSNVRNSNYFAEEDRDIIKTETSRVVTFVRCTQYEPPMVILYKLVLMIEMMAACFFWKLRYPWLLTVIQCLEWNFVVAVLQFLKDRCDVTLHLSSVFVGNLRYAHGSKCGYWVQTSFFQFLGMTK